VQRFALSCTLQCRQCNRAKVQRQCKCKNWVCTD